MTTRRAFKRLSLPLFLSRGFCPGVDLPEAPGRGPSKRLRLHSAA
jgi:hypothetical protein